MHKPLISVVICTYNRARLLTLCLQSLVDQTLDKLFYEVLIINNNSTDDTHAVSMEFCRLHSNFRLFNEPRQGLSHARNRGCQEAAGEYVAYIDDDGKASRNWTEMINSFIARHREVVAFGGPYSAYSLVRLPRWYKESYGTWSLGSEERPIGPLEWINGTNMVFKRSFLADLGGFNPRIGMSGDTLSYGEETNLLVRIKELNHPIYYVPGLLVEHLIGDYKLNLRWLLTSCYRNGLSSVETFNLPVKPLRHMGLAVYQGLAGCYKFVISHEMFLKARVFESFRYFAYHLGAMVRMLKG